MCQSALLFEQRGMVLVTRTSLLLGVGSQSRHDMCRLLAEPVAHRIQNHFVRVVESSFTYAHKS